MVAFACCAGLYASGVGARLRLGKAEWAEDFAARKRPEVLFLLGPAAEFPNRGTDYGIGDAVRDGGRATPARDFLEHQCVADGIGSRAAPFFGHQHAAAAQFAKLAELLGRKFPLALVLAQNGADFRFHEPADGVAD